MRNLFRKQEPKTLTVTIPTSTPDQSFTITITPDQEAHAWRIKDYVEYLIKEKKRMDEGWSKCGKDLDTAVKEGRAAAREFNDWLSYIARRNINLEARDNTRFGTVSYNYYVSFRPDLGEYDRIGQKGEFDADKVKELCDIAKLADLAPFHPYQKNISEDLPGGFYLAGRVDNIKEIKDKVDTAERKMKATLAEALRVRNLKAVFEPKPEGENNGSRS